MYCDDLRSVAAHETVMYTDQKPILRHQLEILRDCGVRIWPPTIEVLPQRRMLSASSARFLIEKHAKRAIQATTLLEDAIHST